MVRGLRSAAAVRGESATGRLRLVGKQEGKASVGSWLRIGAKRTSDQDKEGLQVGFLGGFGSQFLTAVLGSEKG